MKTEAIGIIIVGFILCTGCIEQTEETESKRDNTICIACWNLQTFGPTKAADKDLITYYADHIDDYDICILQEVRDKSGEAIETLAEELPGYTYIESSREGSTSYKEQYVAFYNDKVTVRYTDDYSISYSALFERPPWRIGFQANNWTWDIYTIHTQPENVDQELSNLENIVQDKDEEIIIIGDLNADGSYYNEKERKHLNDWLWIIGNAVDTTVAQNDYTYDRIIVNEKVENNYQSWGVMKDVNTEQSDHYLIYACFNSQVS
jgi:hypothetical protein